MTASLTSSRLSQERNLRLFGPEYEASCKFFLISGKIISILETPFFDHATKKVTADDFSGNKFEKLILSPFHKFEAIQGVFENLLNYGEYIPVMGLYFSCVRLQIGMIQLALSAIALVGIGLAKVAVFLVTKGNSSLECRRFLPFLCDQHFAGWDNLARGFALMAIRIRSGPGVQILAAVSYDFLSRERYQGEKLTKWCLEIAESNSKNKKIKHL